MRSQVIPYEALQQQLDIPTVRQLEDFIITEGFYTNIIAGKLDQKKACLQVCAWYALGDDLIKWVVCTTWFTLTDKCVLFPTLCGLAHRSSYHLLHTQVHNSIGRDVQPEQLPELEAGLQNWCVRASGAK